MASKDINKFMKPMCELMSKYAKLKVCIGEVKMTLTEEHVHFLGLCKGVSKLIIIPPEPKTDPIEEDSLILILRTTINLKKLILLSSECLRTGLQGLTQLNSLTLVSNSNNFLKMPVYKSIPTPTNVKKLNLDLLIQTKDNHKLPVPNNLYHFGCRAKALSHFNFKSCHHLRSITLFHTNLVDESDPLWRLLSSTIHSLRLKYRPSNKEKPDLETDGRLEGKYFGINVPVRLQHLTLKLNFPFSDSYSKHCIKRIFINTQEPQWSNDLLHQINQIGAYSPVFIPFPPLTKETSLFKQITEKKLVMTSSNNNNKNNNNNSIKKVANVKGNVIRKRNKPSLVCANCRRKKIKCDKQTPCHNCVKAGTTDTCTYSVRVIRNPFNNKQEKMIVPLNLVNGENSEVDNVALQMQMQLLKEQVKVLEGILENKRRQSSPETAPTNSSNGTVATHGSVDANFGFTTGFPSHPNSSGGSTYSSSSMSSPLSVTSSNYDLGNHSGAYQQSQIFLKPGLFDMKLERLKVFKILIKPSQRTYCLETNSWKASLPPKFDLCYNG
ncbi:unnamed protein product [Ambrosiozyma monospora]|uniref:Unnamed protein product n=1 Tax=Ambrosiozyma monospora TaxID=43982 RepID=A0ACB5T1Z6_AMBMO|nr:unnamed protein product [Ambrosiozyma monospora]